MTARSPWWTALAVASGLLGAGAGASAQQAPAQQAPAGGYQGQQGLATSLYGGGAMNPYLNPYLMQMGPGNPDYLTYMFLANQRNGGIGTGVISGARTAPGAPIGGAGQGGAAARPASTMMRNSPYPQPPRPDQGRVTLPIIPPGPGGNAGGYFTRGAGAYGGAGRYFSRTIPARNNGR